MTTEQIGLYFGYKIKECDLKDFYNENINNGNSSDNNDSDNTDLWSIRDSIDQFFSGKYASKISCDSLKCCPYDKNSDWIIGIEKGYHNIYTLEGFSLNISTEQEMTDLRTLKRVFKIKNQIPQWYVIANDCWMCT